MIPIKSHAFAELPQEFYTLQNWQGFENPFPVIENEQLKRELNLKKMDGKELLDIFNGSLKMKH